MKRYENKVVMVVGCAQGIGKAVAEAYAAEGAKMAMFDIQEKIEKTVNEVSQRYGYNTEDLIAGFVDIANYESCKDAVQKTMDAFGKIDVIAVLSGIFPETLPVAETPVEMWDRVISVNLSGYFRMVKAVAPVMIEQKAGCILMTGSWSGEAGEGNMASYCCSKAGVIRLTQSLCEEMSQYGVRVNNICPGSIATELHYKAIDEQARINNISVEEQKARDYTRMAVGRPGEPSEVANVFVFLGTDEASYITGATIDVNGGGCYR